MVLVTGVLVKLYVDAVNGRMTDITFSIMFHFNFANDKIQPELLLDWVFHGFSNATSPVWGFGSSILSRVEILEEWRKRNFFQKCFLLLVGNLKISHHNHKI